jgi:hypothetical protein
MLPGLVALTLAGLGLYGRDFVCSEHTDARDRYPRSTWRAFNERGWISLRSGRVGIRWMDDSSNPLPSRRRTGVK